MRPIAEHLFPARTPRAPGSVVMSEVTHEPGTFATHWRNAQDGGRYEGRYHRGYGAALDDYERRVAGEIMDQAYARGTLTGPFRYELFSDASGRAEPVAAGLDTDIGGALAQLRYRKGLKEHPLWAEARILGPGGEILSREINPLHGAYHLPAGDPARLELSARRPAPMEDAEPEASAPGMR